MKPMTPAQRILLRNDLRALWRWLASLDWWFAIVAVVAFYAVLMLVTDV